jgi:hypothetical protein
VSRVVFLVPRRKDRGHRDALWAYCRRRWERYMPDVPVIEGHHDDGPFNRSAAINRAAEKAGDWDVAVVIDSDVMESISSVDAAIASAQQGSVTWAHRRWRGMTEDWTNRLIIAEGHVKDFGAELDRDEIDLYVDRTNPVSWSCCIAVPRAVFDDMGGFDERFKGWGFEDMAFQSLIVGLYPWARVEADVVHLWHPRSEERIVQGQGRITASSEYVTNARLGRRYMVAVRRDHGGTDRLTDTDAAEMARDIDNLKRDDAKFAGAAQLHRLPDWSNWWPTLEELRDGAKEYREGSGLDRTVTLVVHTGGEPDTWETRSGYLKRALESLAANVSGPVVQRVIYSDWGDSLRSELNEIARQHGFYVVGPDKHLGYTGSMAAMWRYLNGRAQGTYVFAAEDDFTYDRPVDLVPMIRTLEDNDHLRQLALLRHAAYPREFEAGGVLQSLKTPTELVNGRPHPFVQHRDHWTANPSLFKRVLTDQSWPQGASSERQFGDKLLRDKHARFAYWGDGQPWITHIGEVRAGVEY